MRERLKERNILCSGIRKNTERETERENDIRKSVQESEKNTEREREEEREIGSANRYKVLFLTPL